MNIEKTIDFKMLEAYSKKTILRGSENYYQYYWEYKTEDGVLVNILGNKISGFIIWRTPPLPIFYKNYSEYYGNGNLKVNGNVIGDGSVRIGEWDYYNEFGDKIKEIDENVKFGKFDYDKLLIYLHLNKYINIETGENRDGLSVGYDEKNNIWTVSITDNNYLETYLKIDGETGSIILEKKYQGGNE